MFKLDFARGLDQGSKLHMLFESERLHLKLGSVTELTGVDHHLVVPKLSALARGWQGVPGSGNTRYDDWTDYNRALEVAVNAFRIREASHSMRLVNSLVDRGMDMDFGPRFHRLRTPVARFYAEQERKTEGDFMVLDLEVGQKVPQGKSPEEAYEHIRGYSGYPLDPIALMCLRYTHSHLSHGIYWFDALGAEVSPKGDGRFDDAPYLDCRNDEVNADWNWKKRARPFRIAPYARGQ